MKPMHVLLTILFFSHCSGSCKGQNTFGDSLLQLDRTIPLPEVKGRIDHLDVNLQDTVIYMAALGNNTVEVIDLRSNKVIHSIKNMNEPQGVCYIPGHHEIFIANGGTGACYFYDTRNFKRSATVSLQSDADDARYDASTGKIYTGYGTGGIAVIDATTHLQTGDVKLPGHPESFQVDAPLQQMFVNIPDAHMVAVIDLRQLKVIKQWVRNSPTGNFPMAIDTTSHRLFIGYRHPSRLIAIDGTNGREIINTTMAGDADDLYIDRETGKIIVSGGDGYINLFQLDSTGKCEEVANIATSSGARTSLSIPELRLYVLAARAVSGKPAQLLVYKILK